MNKHISQIAGLFVIAIACLVLIGWQFDINLLKTGFPGITATMKVNIAICFLLAGMSLILLQCKQSNRIHHRVSQIFAGAIAVVGLLTLGEYLFGWNLHIDELFFRDVVSSSNPYAGRMSISTATNFVLMGVALLLLGQNSQLGTWLAQIFATNAALISLLAFCGYIFDVDIFERLFILTTNQALISILTFSILYVGILAIRPKQGFMQVVTSPLVGGLTARWLLPWAIIFPVALNWFSLQGEQLGWYDAKFGYTLRSSFMVLTCSILIWGTARFLNQIDLNRQQAELALKKLNETLETLVAKRTEALQTSQARFAGILEIADDAIISVDHAQRITLFNQGAEKIFGYRSAEVLGKSLSLLLPERFKNAHEQHIQQFAQSSSTSTEKARKMGERSEIYGHRQNGIEFPAEASISKLEISGEIIFTVILRDISDRKQIEIDLQTSSEQFRHAFEDASIGIAILSLEGHWLKVNPALCEIVGYSSEDLLNFGFQDITVPEDLEADLINIHNLSAGRISTYQREKRYIHKQGHIVWVLVNGSVIQDRQKKPLHIIAQIQDITARKASQKELELQSQIIHNMAGGVALIKASDFIIVYTNPKFDSLFGYTEGELVGQPVGVINYVDTEVTSDASVMDIIKQLDRYGEAQYEVHNKKKDGTLFWCRVHTSKFEHPEYGIVYVAVQEDVTELKLAEQALQTSTNRLNFLLNYSPVVIFCSKPDGDYGATFVSKNIEDVFGYEAREFVEDSGFWVNHIHPDDVELVLNDLGSLLNSDFYSHEYRFRRSDGDYRWVLNQLRLIRDKAGIPTEILGYLIDISDRKHTELLQQEKEEAEAANRAKSIFLSNMSHELRTPLNSILGFTQLILNEDSLSPSSQERLQIITRSGEYLLDLINDILNLSKIESGRMTLNNSEFDLTNLLTSIEEMLRVRIQPKKLDLIFQQDPNLPRYIYTDEQKLYQVLVNLLGNAIKFTNQGSVILRVRVESREETSCNLYFEIKDTGVGISPDEIDNLFKVFVQAQAGNNLNQGTGLGLAISQKIMQLMGSQIQVQSTLNQGSTFSFKIEVQLPQVAVFTSELVNQRVIGLAINQPPYRILVVEDLSENRLLLVGILSAIGFEVREATQGIEAIALWENWLPHLILMDIRMPLMDGYTATKCIRENTKSQETIIIALTASVFEEDREKVLNVGCNDFIRKPFQQKELFEKIAQYLGVQYIYEIIGESPQKSSVEILSVEALSEMSPQWLEEMYQAAYYLDTDVMNELIAQIPESKASLSKLLTDSINNFNSDRIMELIRCMNN